MLSGFSCIQLFATLWTVAHQALLFMGFSREEYWSGLPCPSPGDLPDPGIEPASSAAPPLKVDSLPLSRWGNPSVTIFSKQSKVQDTVILSNTYLFYPQP